MDQQQPVQTRKEYNKLVRDKVPDILSEKGIVPYTHIARNSELEQALWDKVAEEFAEILKKPLGNLRKQINEAKVRPQMETFVVAIDAVCAVAAYEGSSPPVLDQVRQQKKAAKGAFPKGLS